MFRDWIKAIRIFSTRLKIERPLIPIFPRFRTTQFFLWVVALFGLGYGHFYAKGDDSQSISLFLSLVSWLGAVFILLLVNPLPRLKRLILQILSIMLLMGFFVAASITYSFLFFATSVVGSIKIAWIGGAILLGLLAIYSLSISFIRIQLNGGESYPGMRSAPFLFLLLAVNYLLWSWSTIISFFV